MTFESVIVWKRIYNLSRQLQMRDRLKGGKNALKSLSRVLVHCVTPQLHQNSFVCSFELKSGDYTGHNKNTLMIYCFLNSRIIFRCCEYIIIIKRFTDILPFWKRPPRMEMMKFISKQCLSFNFSPFLTVLCSCMCLLPIFCICLAVRDSRLK